MVQIWYNLLFGRTVEYSIDVQHCFKKIRTLGVRVLKATNLVPLVKAEMFK